MDLCLSSGCRLDHYRKPIGGGALALQSTFFLVFAGLNFLCRRPPPNLIRLDKEVDGDDATVGRFDVGNLSFSRDLDPPAVEASCQSAPGDSNDGTGQPNVLWPWARLLFSVYVHAVNLNPGTSSTSQLPPSSYGELNNEWRQGNVGEDGWIIRRCCRPATCPFYSISWSSRPPDWPC